VWSSLFNNVRLLNHCIAPLFINNLFFIYPFQLVLYCVLLFSFLVKPNVCIKLHPSLYPSYLPPLFLTVYITGYTCIEKITKRSRPRTQVNNACQPRFFRGSSNSGHSVRGQGLMNQFVCPIPFCKEKEVRLFNSTYAVLKKLLLLSYDWWFMFLLERLTMYESQEQNMMISLPSFICVQSGKCQLQVNVVSYARLN
jgi:hypothetical protein